jgi:cytoskeletal protein RodZ
MALTKALALADPGNQEAQALQNAIRADVRRDLDDARALLDQSATGTKEDSKKYRKAAEIILLKTLYLDSENQEAKVLLQSARALSGSADKPVYTPPERSYTPPAPQVFEAPRVTTTKPEFQEPASSPIYTSRTIDPPRFEEPPVAAPLVEERSTYHEPVKQEDKWDPPHQWEKPHAAEDDEVPFTVAPPIFEKREEKKGRGKLPIALAAVLVLGVGLAYRVYSGSSRRNAQPAPAAAKTEAPARVDNTVSAPPQNPATTPPPAQTNAAPPAPVVVPTPAPAPPAPEPPAPAAPAMGKLAVSSPTSAEIFLDNKFIGSTPTTLELPPGRQRLEYRHGDLKTVVTHDIKANSTVTASVTFQITVQINARPWAQVSVEGPPRRSLGQTPLSGVIVPIGAVLTFENPGFESKTYRVTDKDTAIQVNFP